MKFCIFFILCVSTQVLGAEVLDEVAVATTIAPEIDESPAELDESRILNGRYANANQFKYAVSLQKKNIKSDGGLPIPTTKHFCGGVILNPEWILTAAHCVSKQDQLGNYFINAGVKNCYNYDLPSQAVPIQEAIINEKYSNKTDQNDIALLKLARPLELNVNVQPIALPPKNYTKAKGLGHIIGWGRIGNGKVSSRYLLQAEIPVAEDFECEYYFKGMDKLLNQICFTNNLQRACQGDSGGPFVQVIDGKPRVVGVTSIGDKGCALFSTVLYTKVSAYVDWIEQVMSGEVTTQKPEATGIRTFFSRFG